MLYIRIYLCTSGYILVSICNIISTDEEGVAVLVLQYYSSTREINNVVLLHQTAILKQFIRFLCNMKEHWSG